MITAGLLGRKSGRGFYTYEAPDSPVVVADSTVSAAVGGSARDVHRVGVIGTGTMATGIVEVFAKAGHDVVLRARGVDKGRGRVGKIRKSLDKAVVRGKLAEADRDAALARIHTTVDFESAGRTVTW